MSFLTLLIVAGGSTFALIWCLHYVPIISKTPWGHFSPRLMACKVLAPFDAGITFFLIVGGMTGILTTATGISMIVYNTLVAIGISIGVYIVTKWFKPRWQKEFQAKQLQTLQEK